jgi:hypothetical protein
MAKRNKTTKLLSMKESDKMLASAYVDRPQQIFLSKDKIKMMLTFYKSKMDNWGLFIGLLSTLITVILSLLTTTNFNNFIYLQGCTWKIIFYIVLVFLVILILINLIINLTSFNENKVINEFLPGLPDEKEVKSRKTGK